MIRFQMSKWAIDDQPFPSIDPHEIVRQGQLRTHAGFWFDAADRVVKQVAKTLGLSELRPPVALPEVNATTCDRDYTYDRLIEFVHLHRDRYGEERWQVQLADHRWVKVSEATAKQVMAQLGVKYDWQSGSHMRHRMTHPDDVGEIRTKYPIRQRITAEDLQKVIDSNPRLTVSGTHQDGFDLMEELVEVNLVSEYIHTHTIKRGLGSYTLKHLAEEAYRHYVPNGAAIAALRHHGVKTRRSEQNDYVTDPNFQLGA